LPAAAGGGQSKVGVGIFPEKGSNFNQKRQQKNKKAHRWAIFI